MKANSLSYVDNYVKKHKKSTAASYFLWVFLGGLGAHRFYHGKIITGLIQLFLTLTCSWWTLYLVPGLWVFIDGILIYFWLKKDKERLKTEAYENLNLVSSHTH